MNPASCILCGSTDQRTIATYTEPDRYECAAGVVEAGYARQWAQCTECNFHYSRYSRDLGVLDRLYDTTYRNAAAIWRSEMPEETFRKIIALPPEQSETVTRCRVIKATLYRLAQDNIHALSKHRPLRLLDVGGATGVFAFMFQDEDWQAEIVDPSLQGRFIEHYGVTYHQKRMDAEFSASTYDLISMVYVLEHLDDPKATISAARMMLGEAGLLYVEVPDEVAFEKKEANDEIFNACHLWMFGPDSLSRLLTSCGFDPLDMRRIRTLRDHYALAILARAK